MRNQFSSPNDKMKSLKQELAKSKTKLEKLSCAKLAVVDRSVSVSSKPKDKNVHVSPFKRNHKEKTYFVKLDKGKSSDIDAEISKPKSKPTNRLLKKYIFVPTYHLYGVVGHIRSKFSLLR